MKIAILTASYLPAVGGRQVFAYNISRRFAASGHTVDVYVPKRAFQALRPPFLELLRPLPRWFYGLVWKLPAIGLFRAQCYLRRVQRTEGYDAWLTIATFPSGYVGACLQGTVPTVLRASGDDIQKSAEMGYGLRLDPRLEAKIRRAVRSFDSVVAMTETARTDLLDLGVRQEAIVGIPNGVDVDWFAPERDIAWLRGELGWPDDRPVILTTGRNHPKKGYNLIPPIAERLREQGLQFRWYVVGQGADRINDAIGRRGLEEYVMTLGQVDMNPGPGSEWRFPDRKLVMMYQAADVYAFPSLLENFPMVLYEAMAAGAVVVATDAPGCHDVFRHGETGLQARAGDIDDFACQLGSVLSDPELRRALAKRAGEFVKEFSWEKVAEQYENVIRKLCDGYL